MNENEVTCSEVMSKICESLDEELNSEKCKAIRAHIDSCPCCSNYHKSLNNVIELYREYSFPLSDDSHAKLMKVLKLE